MADSEVKNDNASATVGDATKDGSSVCHFCRDRLRSRALLEFLLISSQTVTGATSTPAPGVKDDDVFAMFGGGAKKTKKPDDEDRGDNSGSAKAQRDAAAAAGAGEEAAEVNYFLLWSRHVRRIRHD